MSKLRLAIVAILFLLPWLFLAAVGSYFLWERGWIIWAWWPMFASFGLSYWLAWRWTRRRGLLPPTDTPPPNFWTDRDKLAWEAVEAKAKSFERVSAEQLSDPRHYSEVAVDLAERVAKAYHPEGATPFDHLTLPEILACVELASADITALVNQYVPGSHMFTVGDLQTARKAMGYYRFGQNAYWAGSAVLNPVQAGLRWAVSRYGLGTLLDKLQDNILLWFHTVFVHKLGYYLIEMNSGRLRVGVKRYREIREAHGDFTGEAPPSPAPSPEAGPPAAPVPGPKPISLAVIGPVKAGKSSLVNALLGQAAAAVDALPVPSLGIRYQFTLPDGQPLVLLDTSGYGQDGPNEAEFAAAAQAARESDLVVFVTTALNPGRKNDIELLDRLQSWFAQQPELKAPPILAAVNQIDLLSPKAEWSPPYDWQSGAKPKEASIRDCVSAVREQLGGRVVAIVPVCGRTGETFGFQEGLIPAIALHLDEARGAAMLKAFHAEGHAAQFQKLGQQIVSGGKKLMGMLWKNLNEPR